MLGWTQEELAKNANVGLSTVRDYESERRSGELIGAKAIRQVLEEHGVVLLSSEGDFGPGVRLIAKTPNLLRRPTKLGRLRDLTFPVEWRGREIEVFVPFEVFDDLDGSSGHRTDAGYISFFDRHRVSFLKAAGAAIDAGRVTSDRRVHLKFEDLHLSR